MKKSWLSLLIVFLAGCGHVLYADGPYHGKVIDKQTKQPIEGAAVVAVWMKESPFIGHYMVRYYDAQETVTDQEGNFTIPGIVGGSANPLAKIREPSFTIFKPGYVAYRNLAFKPISVSGNIEVFEKDSLVVFALGRLTTREERMRNLIGLNPAPRCGPQDDPASSLCLPDGKYPNLIRLKNVEERDLGLEPTQRQKGVK